MSAQVDNEKGPKLNQRVGSLFERAGFESLPNSSTTKEFEVTVHEKTRPLDLWARDKTLGVTIVGSNKAGKIAGGFSAHISDLKLLAAAAHADATILTMTGYEVDASEIKAAKAAGVCVWTDNELAYYDALTDAIRDYARYEIINSLGLTTKEDKTTVNVVAIRIKQPTSSSPTELFMFSMSPERLLKTCCLFRRAIGNAEAYQRMVSKKRLPGIRKFVSKYDALLPTNIVVSLDETKVSVYELEKSAKIENLTSKALTLTTGAHDLVVLSIPLAYGTMELLDGQHRLFGFAETPIATRQEFNLAVVGVKGLSKKQKQNTFVAINDNSRRMDPNLVAYLQYEKDDSICQKDSKLMAIRVAVDLAQRSPFKKKLRVLDLGKQTLTLKGVSGYDLKGLVGPKGELRNVFPTNTPADYVTYLANYFSLVRTTFKDEWDTPSEYVIATNRGVTAFLKLLKSMLANDPATKSPDKCHKYIQALKGFDWKSKTLKQNYVGSQGWKKFHLDLVKHIRKKYPSFTA
ncbi:MAG: DGQHR domain-containing protein [Acidobacteriaceae bacterium]